MKAGKPKMLLSSLLAAAVGATVRGPSGSMARTEKWRRNVPSSRSAHGSRSPNKYKPHQGKAECARRRRQMKRDGALPES